MGVPALFRWLSKKYPKIILPVVEEEENKVPDDAGNNVTIPVDITGPNPNDVEFDNLYLDMNGIVHPCTHPEGKPAPETEEEMMVEVFKYTERIVNMIRPRKLLFMAIDGVAPRAKMNQQRSRRFRSAQEAKDKEEARKEAVAMWESMGKTLSEEEKNKESWDSNAITPGTPFMDLLAMSLRYWVVRKMNTDPGWKKMQVIISDASVPGEGEHKIMDFIRRQRVNPGHDANTRHVIYGLDADLIMLSLATHEPHFRVLREDVFFQDGSATACRICGQEGHFAAQCTGVKAEITKKVTPPEKKPFIFLDIPILREYLEFELNVPHAPFPFDLEQAIDDWVLLIFFVGNDFLPHLPSLEIREGAIDTLLKIWKQELPRMGGYLTNHGQVELARAQIILEGLAKREDEIFMRRRETEQRQDQNAKRRKWAADAGSVTAPSPALQLTAAPTAPTAPTVPSIHPSLPQRPSYDFPATADSIGLGASPTAQSTPNVAMALQAVAGSNHDVVANRKAIRLANMSAAQMLKAELSGKPSSSPERDLSLPPKPSHPLALPPFPVTIQAVPMSVDLSTRDIDVQLPGLSGNKSVPAHLSSYSTLHDEDTDVDHDVDQLMEQAIQDLREDAVFPGFSQDGVELSMGDVAEEVEPVIGVKRKIDEVADDAPAMDLVDEDEDEDAPAEARALAMKVNPDGTVEQEDTVKLWEPGYRQRYFRQKFGVDETDEEFKKQLTQTYVEGMIWVLQYYYQGTPSWQWYYPYHFAPFAADFKEIHKMDIEFNLGQPFKPFEQLMGVFPAASRKHLPAILQPLMTNEDSPIIDFYPPTFEIDMNGKKMAWQGVALLPFIDERRLLDAMTPEYPKLTEEEVRRNRWGNIILFVTDEHALYPFFETLYGKKTIHEPVRVDRQLSDGINGSVLRNPDCIPGSTYESPLSAQNLPDMPNDRSLSVLYFFPKQLTPHRSVLLPGLKRPTRVLRGGDLDRIRGGGRGGMRGGRPMGDTASSGPIRGSDFVNGYQNQYQSRRPAPYPSNQYSGRGGSRGYGGPSSYGGSRGGESYNSYSQAPRHSYPPHTYDGHRGDGPYGGYNGASSAGRGGSYRGAPPSYGGYRTRGGSPGRGGHGSYAGNHSDAYGSGGYSASGRGRGW